MIESIILASLVLFYLMVASGVYARDRQVERTLPRYPGLASMGKGALLWPVLFGYELARFATTPMWVDVQEAGERIHDKPNPE